MATASISYQTMSKKKPSLADKILDYIKRNEKEQPVPPGYKGILEWCKILGCSRRKWGIMLHDLLKTTKVKQVRIRRVDKGKIRMFNFYKIDEDFLRLMRK
jgi:hypothetical protein